MKSIFSIASLLEQLMENRFLNVLQLKIRFFQFAKKESNCFSSVIDIVWKL